MSNAVTPILFIVLLASGIAYVAQPEMPANDCKVKNEDLSKMCLSYIPNFYEPGHLTFLGHTKAWGYRWVDKIGIGLGENQARWLAQYSSFEDAVNCYFTAAGDISLNMTLTPTEFETRYAAIAPDQPLN